MHHDESSVLRVGIVGAGGVAARHAATLAELDGVHVAAVTDVDPQRAAALADAHGARVHTDLPALLDAEAPDALWLCLPPFAHGEAERVALAAGVPFFVEKPLSVDPAVAEDIGAAVEAAGLVTGTGYHWRCMPGVERAAEVVRDRPVRLVHGAWLDKVPPVAWWPRRDLSGGQLVEQATHLVDTMRALVGEPVAVQALPAEVAGRDAALVDVATAATLRFATGAVGTLTATSALTWKHAASLTLVADDVLVEVGETRTTIRVGDRTEVVEDDGVSKRRVDAEFCDAVRRRDPSAVRVPYAEALRTHRVAAALAESARTGGTVEVRRDARATDG